MNIETDAASMARLFSFHNREPIMAATADWWTLRKDEVRIIMLALDEQGEAIGYYDVDREAWMKPGLNIKIIVAPHARNQGLGTDMYELALRAARELGATELESNVREADIASIKFVEEARLQDRSFITFEIERSDLTHFDVSQI